MMDDQMDRTIQDAAAEYNRPPEPPREEMWRAIMERESAPRPLDDSAAPLLGGSAAGGVVLPFRRRALRFAVPIGVAALLTLAFGLGRVSVDEPVPGSAPIAADAPAQPSAPLAGATADSAAATELVTNAPTDEPSRRAAQPTSRLNDPSHLENPAAQPPSRPAAEFAESAEPGTDALALAAREHLAQAETFLVLFRASLNAGQPVEPVVPATARYLLASNRLLIDSPAAEQPGMRRLLNDVELVLAQIAQLPADSAATTDERLITDGMEQRDLLLRIRTAAGSARGMPNQGVL
jgi:hypothetical protein